MKTLQEVITFRFGCTSWSSFLAMPSRHK